MRDWIDTNSWIVNEIVIGFFLLPAAAMRKASAFCAKDSR
jgi:hypothetical protein